MNLFYIIVAVDVSHSLRALMSVLYILSTMNLGGTAEIFVPCMSFAHARDFFARKALSPAGLRQSGCRELAYRQTLLPQDYRAIARDRDEAKRNRGAGEMPILRKERKR